MNNLSLQVDNQLTERANSVRWTHKLVAKEAEKFSTRREFKASCSGGYGYACRHKILDKICAHMPPPEKKIMWSLEKIREKAWKYNDLKDFRKYEPHAYRASLRIGVSAQIVEYMKSDGRTSKTSIKKLAFFKKKQLASLNDARAVVGLKPLKISIRKCIVCATDFESIEARTCGCLSRVDPATRFDPLLN